MASGDKVKIVGICGSLRRSSYTRMALKVALHGAEGAGAETQLIDLRDYKLVFCDGGDSDDKTPQDVLRLREEVQHAQGVILATPEYHGGYSGVLKNALDLMGFDEFEGKMIGLVGVSGGGTGAFGALSAFAQRRTGVARVGGAGAGRGGQRGRSIRRGRQLPG